MKQKLIGLLLASTGSYAFAFGNYTGFYAGIGGGVIQGEFQSAISTNAVNVPRNALDLFNVGNKLSDISGIGAIFLGYGWCMNEFTLAPEIYGSLDNLRTTSNAFVSSVNPRILGSFASSFTTQLRQGEFGIDVRPGAVLPCSALLYGRIGAAFNRVTVNPNVAVLNNTGGVSDSLSYNGGNSITGLRLGIGLEHMVMDYFSIRGDYIYTDYGRASVTGISDSGDILDASTAKVRTNAFMLSVVYHVDNGCPLEK